ncbi:MAG TPA: phosphatase PAP2 family protein [Acidimicrobiales bacterium]|nr:phosphatase PAP2 family protein [Acidimicrobiales bacterium]
MAARRNVLLGAAAVLVVTGFLAEQRTPWSLERRLGRWVYDWPDWLETPLTVVMQSGARVAIVIVAAGLIVVGRYRAALAAALGGTGAWLVSSMLKAWLDRPRPSLGLVGRDPRDVVDHAAWPSGHATIAAALGVVLLLTVATDRISRAVVIAAVLLTAVARLYLGVHWALDVLGGIALGTLAAHFALLGTKAS